jgi:transcriptional regulator with XRE-family HTH domain
MNIEKRYGMRNLEDRLGKLTMGEFLRTWRETEELTLKEFGKLLGISISNLCDIEKGRKGVSPEKADKIAKALDVPPPLLIRLSIEDSLRAAGLNYEIEVNPSA